MNASARDVWFFSRDGQQSGPLTFRDLKEKADEGVLRPRHDLVWKEGMADWRPIGEVEGLFERKPLQTIESAQPFVPPIGVISADDPHAEYGGFPGARRRSYLFATLLFPFIWGFLLHFAATSGTIPVDPALLAKIVLWGQFLPAVVAVYFIIQRLANLGMSRLWFLGHFVPILQIWLGYREFACPAGYAIHKKMDGVGIFLAIIYWLVIVISIVAIGLVVAVMGGMIGDHSTREAVEKIVNPVMEQIRTQTRPIGK